MMAATDDDDSSKKSDAVKIIKESIKFLIYVGSDETGSIHISPHPDKLREFFNEMTHKILESVLTFPSLLGSKQFSFFTKYD